MYEDKNNRIQLKIFEPVGPALAQMKMILFDTGSFEKWFMLGFCAWLAQLGQGGGGKVNYRQGGDNFRGSPMQLWDSVKDHPYIIPIVISIVCIAIILMILVIWISSRGRFMFLHGIIHNRGEVVYPWKKYREQGNSLFMYRLVVGTIWLMFMAITVVCGIVLASIFKAASMDTSLAVIVMASASGLFALFLGIITFIFLKLTNDFAVPVMLMRRCTCTEAWYEIKPLVMDNAGTILLYLLFHILLMAVTVVVFIIAGIVTIGCMCCLSVFPYIGTVATLPIPVFFRCYSAIFLSQFGDDYNCFKSVNMPDPGYGPGDEILEIEI